MSGFVDVVEVAADDAFAVGVDVIEAAATATEGPLDAGVDGLFYEDDDIACLCSAFNNLKGPATFAEVFEATCKVIIIEVLAW